MRFCEKLREIRKNKRLTQRELGAMIGRTGATICDWEKGKASPNLDELVALANIFSVTTDYLLGRLNAYMPMERFMEVWAEKRERILSVTLFKKYNMDAMRQLDQLIAAYPREKERDTLLYQIFRSVGYRIDMLPVPQDEWEEPVYELPEQRERRLMTEAQEKERGKRSRGKRP